MEYDDNVTLTPTEKFPAQVQSREKIPESEDDTICYCRHKLAELGPRIRQTSRMMSALHAEVVGT